MIAVLRDPVERAISAYLHEVKHGRELRPSEEVFDLPTTSPEEAVTEEPRRIEASWRKSLIQPHNPPEQHYRDPVFQFSYVGNSFYRLQLAAWIATFPQFYVLDFADLRENPSAAVDRVRAALGLGPRPPIRTDTSRNTTRLRLRVAICERLSLTHDYARVPAPMVLWRMGRLFSTLRRERPTLPAALAESLRADFEWFRCETEQLWI